MKKISFSKAAISTALLLSIYVNVNAQNRTFFDSFREIRCSIVACSETQNVNQNNTNGSFETPVVTGWQLPEFNLSGFREIFFGNKLSEPTNVNLPAYTNVNANISDIKANANSGITAGDILNNPNSKTDTANISKPEGCLMSAYICNTLLKEGIIFDKNGPISKTAEVKNANPVNNANESLSGTQMNQQQKVEAQNNGNLIPRDNNISQADASRYAPSGYEYVRTVNEDGEEVNVDGYARRNDKSPDLNNLNFKSVCGKESSGTLVPVNAKGHSGWEGLGTKIKNDVMYASAAVGKAPRFTSGYRSQSVQNGLCAKKAAGIFKGSVACDASGKGASQHTTGNAVDITFSGYTNEEKVKFILVMMSLGYSVINYNPDTHTHFGLDGGQNRWVTNGTTPPAHTRYAFKLTGASSGMSRSQISEKANAALKTMCN